MAKLFIDDSIVITNPDQLEALADKAIAGADYFFNLMDAQFYYNWGNEPMGYCSIGMYDENEVYHSLGHVTKEDIQRYKIPYHNPHS